MGWTADPGHLPRLPPKFRVVSQDGLSLLSIEWFQRSAPPSEVRQIVKRSVREKHETPERASPTETPRIAIGHGVSGGA